MDAAAILYGEPAAAVAAPLQSDPPASASAAVRDPANETAPDASSDDLALPVPDGIRELRASTEDAPAEVLYSGSIDPLIETYLNPLGDTMPLAMRKAVGVELMHVSRDLGLDAEGIQSLIARGAHPEVRGMTAAQADANQATAKALLRQEYGDRSEQVLSDAQRLVQRDPRVAEMLKKSQLGNDPQTILQFARLAVRQRTAGRLK